MSLPFTKTEINRMHKRRRKSFHALDELERELIYLEEIGHIIENFTDQNIPLYLYSRIAVHTKNVRIHFNRAHKILFE